MPCGRLWLRTPDVLVLVARARRRLRNRHWIRAREAVLQCLVQRLVETMLLLLALGLGPRLILLAIECHPHLLFWSAGVNAERSVMFPTQEPAGNAHHGSPTTITCSRRGPCAPRISVCSMSAERDGPVIRLTVRGITPSPNLSRSRCQIVS